MVLIDSSPGNAAIKLNDVNYGLTPVRLNLRRSEQNATIEISLEGFQTKEVHLTQSINGWVWGNILIGGLIGVVIDASTGAIYTHKLPETATSEKVSSSSKKKPEGVDIWIDVTLKPLSKLTKIDQLTPFAQKST